MDINSQAASTLQNFQEAHREDIEAIAQLLVKITHRTPEQIKPYHDVLLEQLAAPQEVRPFYDTATPEEWSAAFREWVDSHRDLNFPPLSDEAISRESIYGERG